MACSSSGRRNLQVRPSLRSGEDAAPCVLLDRVRLQIEQRGDVGGRQDILKGDAHAETDSSLIALITLLSM